MAEQNSLPGIDVETKIIDDPSHAHEKAIFEQLLEDVPFGESYAALLGEGWYWRDAAYIAWKSMPKALRQPETEESFCELIGISRRGMIQRRRKNAAIEIRAAKGVVQNVLNQSLDEVVDALVDSASNSNYKNHPDRKLFLEMAGAYTPKQALEFSTVDTDDLSDLSEEELRRLEQKGNNGS